jgi:hypothetical protein
MAPTMVRKHRPHHADHHRHISGDLCLESLPVTISIAAGMYYLLASPTL